MQVSPTNVVKSLDIPGNGSASLTATPPPTSGFRDVVAGFSFLPRTNTIQTLNERALMQRYAANSGQLLESALSRPENAKPFTDAGGDEVLLKMFSLAVPGPRPLLARVSCAWGSGSGGGSSSSSSAHPGLANHTASQALTAAMKALGTHDTGRVLKRVLAELSKELDRLEVARKAVLDAGVSGGSGAGPHGPPAFFRAFAFYLVGNACAYRSVFACELVALVLRWHWSLVV